MKIIIQTFILGFSLLLSVPIFAQQTDLEKLQAQKQEVKAKQDQLLKEEIENIQHALEKNEISSEEAEKKKRLAAEKHRQQIEEQQKIIDANIELISKSKTPEKTSETKSEKDSNLKVKTYGNLIMNFGFSNTIAKGKSIGDDYKVAGSRFFDIGFEWSTGLTKKNFFRMNYGVNLQFNGLKPKDDHFFIKENDQIILEDFGKSLKKSKLRMDNLVIPLHFELGPTDSRGYAEKFRIGVGGYAGLNLATVQKLKYKEDAYRVKAKNYFNSQTEDFIYGLSAYIGYDNFALFVKYDLNPVFKDNETEEKIIAAGLRIML